MNDAAAHAYTIALESDENKPCALHRDALFGFSAWSELAAIVLGLIIMTGARLLRARPSQPSDLMSDGPIQLQQCQSRAYKTLDDDGG